MRGRDQWTNVDRYSAWAMLITYFPALGISMFTELSGPLTFMIYMMGLVVGMILYQSPFEEDLRLIAAEYRSKRLSYLAVIGYQAQRICAGVVMGQIIRYILS